MTRRTLSGIFPAIDIQNGNCVRLFQGNKDMATVYGTDPVQMAIAWEESGARQLHVVDLDGAFDGAAITQNTILAIRQQVSIPIQVGGGIRSYETAAAYLDAGINRIVLGTVALKDRGLLRTLLKKYGDRIAVSVDAKDGYVTTDGWVKKSTMTTASLIEALEEDGVHTIVFTDISRDGAMYGPSTDQIAALQKKFTCEIIASGGISSLSDLQELRTQGIRSAIVGTAFYKGRISLRDAKEVFEC